MTEAYIISKWDDWNGYRSWGIYVENGTLYINVGLDGAGTTINTSISITNNVWHHFGIVLNASDSSWLARVYNASTELVDEQTGTFTATLGASANVPLTIGGDFAASRNFDGKIDGLIVFNDIMYSAGIDQLRDGTYEWVPDSNCKAFWRFESGALGTDSKGTNNFDLPDFGRAPSPDTSDFKDGACSSIWNSTDQTYLMLSDIDLNEGFPFRGFDDPVRTAMTVAGWIKIGNFMPSASQGSKALRTSLGLSL